MSKPDDVSQKAWDSARECVKDSQVTFNFGEDLMAYSKSAARLSIARAIDQAVAEQRDNDAALVENIPYKILLSKPLIHVPKKIAEAIIKGE